MPFSLADLATLDERRRCKAIADEKELLAGRRGFLASKWCDASERKQELKHQDGLCGCCSTAWSQTSAQIGRWNNERGLPPRRARSGQRGKRSREYDRSTKSDRQIVSTTKPRLRQCVTARQRPHFPLYQSQRQERCRRKGSSEYENGGQFSTNPD